jgi:glutamate N-acetyltransferase / amino-acid N-acetyltransferase
MKGDGTIELPHGFTASAGNAGVKDTTDDVALVVSDEPANAAAVFTRSRFAGPSVVISRRHVSDGRLRACVVVSKNANVATGPAGMVHATELAGLAAGAAGCGVEDVLVASTGVIGRPYPMDRLRAYFERVDFPAGTDLMPAAKAIMTTDTRPKTASACVGPARVVGMAKGSGMIEPDMATMIALLFTDAAVPAGQLDGMFRRAVDVTFNSLTIDSDTSTSDTAAVMANGAAGPVDLGEFAGALQAVCLDLTRQLACDGEGATKLLVVEVSGARDDAQARRVARAVANSPLVKAAVHGADPNWGRVAMAVGKCQDDLDIEPERVVIRFGPHEVYPSAQDGADLGALARYMTSEEVRVGVDLGIAGGSWTIYGCDLGDGYVRINADYTT